MKNRKDLFESREEAIALFECYKPLLTDEAIRRFEEYYYDDLSLSEMAEISSVSRSAIHDALKNTLEKLSSLEEKLQLLKKRKNIANRLSIYKEAKGEDKEKALFALLEDIENAI